MSDAIKESAQFSSCTRCHLHNLQISPKKAFPDIFKMLIRMTPYSDILIALKKLNGHHYHMKMDYYVFSIRIT